MILLLYFFKYSWRHLWGSNPKYILRKYIYTLWFEENCLNATEEDKNIIHLRTKATCIDIVLFNIYHYLYTLDNYTCLLIDSLIYFVNFNLLMWRSYFEKEHDQTKMEDIHTLYLFSYGRSNQQEELNSSPS